MAHYALLNGTTVVQVITGVDENVTQTDAFVPQKPHKYWAAFRLAS